MSIVTGGAGVNGSNLVARLIDEGHQVSINDTLGTGQKWRNLAKHPFDQLIPPGTLPDFLASRGHEVELVYHLGAITSTTETDRDLLTETNIRLSQRIWRWCTDHQGPLVYASSAATYGDGSSGFVDDDSAEALARLHPLNDYAWSKHEFDRWAVHEAARSAGAPPVWYGLKLFNVYGPNEYHKGDMQSVVAKTYPNAERGKPATLFRSHRSEYEDGGQRRDFVYVSDCVDVMMWLVQRRPTSGLYNVGTGRAQSWLELMRALYGAAGQEPRIDWIDIPEDLRDRYQYFTEADTTKLRAAGYERSFLPVEDGVRDYVERYLAAEDPYR